MVASLVFLTPWAALASLAVVVPLAAVAVVARREEQARRVLRLDDPPGGRRARHALAIAAAVALLGVAAAQPVIRSTTERSVRTDAEAIYVIDTSRSMLASKTRQAPTRIERARTAAVRLRAELADVPAGVATLTDRVLPDLLPNASIDVFERTVRGAVRVDNPPPQERAINATSLGALAALGTQSFFSPSARHRLVVVFTDGESQPYDVPETVRALNRTPGVTTLFVHVGSRGEAVYGSDGRPEPGYHEDASSRATLATLADATRGSVVGEGSIGAATRLARSALGVGPNREEGLTQETRTLAPWFALAALLPIALAFGFGGTKVRSVFQSRRAKRVQAPAGASPRDSSAAML